MTIYDILYFYLFLTGTGAILGVLWSLLFSFPKWK